MRFWTEGDFLTGTPRLRCFFVRTVSSHVFKLSYSSPSSAHAFNISHRLSALLTIEASHNVFTLSILTPIIT